MYIYLYYIYMYICKHVLAHMYMYMYMCRGYVFMYIRMFNGMYALLCVPNYVWGDHAFKHVCVFHIILKGLL